MRGAYIDSEYAGTFGEDWALSEERIEPSIGVPRSYATSKCSCTRTL